MALLRDDPYKRRRRTLPGRGASINPPPRFEPHYREEDAETAPLAEEDPPSRPETTLTREACRSAISWNESPDLGFDRSANPYRGCEHGCIYCYARPSHAYLGLSPGLDFETRLFFKPDIAERLREEWRKPGYGKDVRPLALGINTDPYQPAERQLRLTRAILEAALDFRHPVTIVTKSAGILRDLDLLAELAAKNLVRVCLSVTTLDRDLARIMEPRAATPSRRLEALRALRERGIPAGILYAPVIPGLNDEELEAVLAAACDNGAAFAGWVLLRLPHEVKDLFRVWLETHLPARAPRVLGLLGACRGEGLNDPRFHHRMRGEGVYARLIAQRFRRASARLGFEAPPPLACDLFAPPDERRQLALPLD
jgi:DNA repair photolyase